MRAIRSGVVQSACDLSVGGLAVALAKCVTDSGLGANVQLGGDLVAELFSESQSRFLLSVRPETRSFRGDCGGGHDWGGSDKRAYSAGLQLGRTGLCVHCGQNQGNLERGP